MFLVVLLIFGLLVLFCIALLNLWKVRLNVNALIQPVLKSLSYIFLSILQS